MARSVARRRRTFAVQLVVATAALAGCSTLAGIKDDYHRGRRHVGDRGGSGHVQAELNQRFGTRAIAVSGPYVY